MAWEFFGGIPRSLPQVPPWREMDQMESVIWSYTWQPMKQVMSNRDDTESLRCRW